MGFGPIWWILWSVLWYNKTLSESYNAVLKQENEWQELPVNMLVLGFHFLRNYENYEILIVLSGTGNYHLKTGFLEQLIRVTN